LLPVGVAEALEAVALPPTLAALALPLLLPIGVLGISIFIDVFMPCRTLRRMSSYPGGIPGRLAIERAEDAPELMRLRIISVAAEN
jgi:hypothetical protein